MPHQKLKRHAIIKLCQSKERHKQQSLREELRNFINIH